jgi:cysteinyl-tRNA synthetase
LEKASLKENRSAYDIALHYENIFHDYLKQINVKFDIYPKATENIKEQIEFVSILEKK